MKVGIRLVTILVSNIILLAGVYAPIFSPPAYASGENYLFNMASKDDATTIYQQINESSSVFNSNISGGLNNTAVYIKDGIFGRTPFGLNLDQTESRRLGSSAGSMNVAYTGTYFCSDSGQLTTGNADDYAIQLKATTLISVPPAGHQLTDNRLQGALTFNKAVKLNSSKDSGNGTRNEVVLSQIPAKCLPSNIKDTSGKTDVSMANYQSLTSSAKDSWPGVKTSTQISVDNVGDANKCALDNTCLNDPTSTLSKDTCSAPGGFGWAICGLIDVESATISWIEDNIIKPFLDTPRLSFADNSNNPQYQAWSAIRTIANVFFVIIFLVIIFANTFSLQNYNIKKTLPKLVAAAILVQLSFVLMAAAIDITNILGGGLMSLVDGIVPTISIGSHVLQGAGIVLGAGGLAAVAVTAGILSAGVISSMLPLLLGMLAVMFTLVLRQALIVVLVMTAPIAMVALVLPGTEKFFKSWLNLFIRSLLMYPIIVLLFSAGKIAAFAAAATGSAMAPIMAMLCLGVPLLAVPFAFTFAGGLMGRLGKASFGGAASLRKGYEKSGLNQGRIEERKRRVLDQVADDKPPKFLGKTGAVGARANRLRLGINPLKTPAAEASLNRQILKSQGEDEKTFNNQFDLATAHLGLNDQREILADLASGKWGGAHNDIKKRFANRTGTRIAATKKLIDKRGFVQLAGDPTNPNSQNVLANLMNEGPTGERIWQSTMSEKFGDVSKGAPDIAYDGFETYFGNGTTKLGTINGDSLRDLHESTLDRFLHHVQTKGNVNDTVGLVRSLQQAKLKGRPVNADILKKIHQNAAIMHDSAWVQSNIDPSTGQFV